MKFLVVTLLILGLYYSSSAYSSEQSYSARVVDYGPITIIKKGGSASSSGSAKRVYAVDVLETLETTTRVRLGLGVNFGIKFIVEGSEPAEELRVTVKGKHPNMRSSDYPDVKSSYQYEALLTTGELSYVGYEFSSSDEMVEGNWEIQVWYQGKMLLTKTFELHLD